MTLEAQKYKLIQMITGIEDQELVARLESLLLQLNNENKALLEISQLHKKS